MGNPMMQVLKYSESELQLVVLHKFMYVNFPDELMLSIVIV